MSLSRRDLLAALPAAAVLGGSALILGPAAMLAGASAHAQTAAAPDNLFEARAIQAMIWGMPAVNEDLMYQAMVTATEGRVNQILYWSRLLDWKNQTLTPNTDVIYLTPYYDLRQAGPMVLEIPPAEGGVINGTIMDAWQTPLVDVGPAGTDRGAGGKYVILPPDFGGVVPADMIPVPSETWKGYALLRSIPADDSAAALDAAVAYGRTLRFYPLSAAAAPPETVFPDASGILYDATIPYDTRFFESLARIVEDEPWLPRDLAMIDILKTLGIEKGKPFAPDNATCAALDAAALKARDWFDERFDRIFDKPWVQGARWANPALPDFMRSVQSNHSIPNVYAVDERGLMYSFIFFAPKELGVGQFYLMLAHGADGAPLDGSRTYTLKVPTDAPVTQYWSVIAYDRATHALIREVAAPGRSSLTPGLVVNADGTVDLSFGPTPPPQDEANWIPTRADQQFELLFRFYGVKPSLFEKSWVLPDLIPAA